MQQPHQQARPQKRFSEEEALATAEKNLDHTMQRFTNVGLVNRFVHLDIVKDILGSHFVNDINHKLSSYLRTIFIVIGWVSLISGIVGVFSFLVSLSSLGFMFSLGFGIGVRVLIYVLLALAFSLLSLFIGIGLIRSKKRVLGLITLEFLVSAVLFIISRIPVGLYSYRSYGSFGGGLFSLILAFLLFILALKNEHMFKN